MRLTILSCYSGQIERGVEVYVKELSNRLPIELITLPAPEYSGLEPTLLRRLYLDSTSLALFKLTKSVLARLANNPPDILYPVNNGWQSILCKLFCLQHKTKLLLAGHSGPGWDDRVNLWLRPDAFITFSDAQKKWARGVTKKVPIPVIPHAINLDTFKPGKSPLDLKLERPIFISVAALKQGRGETNKNVESTIKAISSLKHGSLLLIGDGNDAGRIDEIAHHKLPTTRYKRVSVSHNIINHYYQLADVFTLASSTSEAFGISYLEALSCNLPIVTTDDHLRREIIGQAGIYIKDPNNINEYSRGLKKVIDINWGNKPRHQAENYSWAKIIPLYENLLKSLVASG